MQGGSGSGPSRVDDLRAGTGRCSVVGARRDPLAGRYQRAPGDPLGAQARGPGLTTPSQAEVTAASTDVNRPRPSADGPVNGSIACSGCGIRPTTRPSADAIPAMSPVDPLGAAST